MKLKIWQQIYKMKGTGKIHNFKNEQDISELWDNSGNPNYNCSWKQGVWLKWQKRSSEKNILETMI